MSSRSPDHIPMVLDMKSTTNSAYTIKGRARIKPAFYRSFAEKVGLVRVKKEGGGTGYIRLYDGDNAQELAEVSFTDSAWTDYDLPLTNFPTTGTPRIECQIKTDGTGTTKVIIAGLEIA